MALTTENRFRLASVMNKIATQPEAHNQATWISPGIDPMLNEPTVNACGTAACFAGWTVLQALSEALVEIDLQIDSLTGIESITLNGERMGVSVAAQQLLGISPRVAAEMFNGINTRPQLYAMVAMILDEDNGDVSVIRLQEASSKARRRGEYAVDGARFNRLNWMPPFEMEYIELESPEDRELRERLQASIHEQEARASV